jgi:8-amino-7-oxononanoate synthase
MPVQGIDFLSNDYLGLNKKGNITSDAMAILDQWKITNSGSGGSRLLSGNYPFIEYAEEQLAENFGFENALIFASGYQANLAVISAACNRHVTVFYDELVHASIIDAVRLSTCRDAVKFRHNDMDHLNELLGKTEGQKLVITESLFSMDGDECPLATLNEICFSHDAVVILDEAHSLGVLGPKGIGMSHLLHSDVLLASMYGFGKAGACEGAVVACSSIYKNWMVNQSRPLIFSTAPSPFFVASILAASELLLQAEDERSNLQKLILAFRNQATTQTNNHWLDSRTPIQGLLIPGNDRVMQAAEHLQKRGISVKGIRKPSVPEGAERIRICLHAYNTEQEIEIFFEELKKI